MKIIHKNAGIAMNSIPLTFNEHQIQRAIIGGKISSENVKMDISVILLNSTGPQFHIPIIENLLTCGFKSIISIEPNNENFNIGNIAKKYPTVKFFIPLEQTSVGELINAAVCELDSKCFLVLKDSLYIPSGFIMENLAENLINEDIFCLVPRLFTKENLSAPMHIIPRAEKGKFLMDQVSSVSDLMPTVFPYDFIGLYNLKKFINLGGFDYTITSSYWQLADLSLRAWLWGEKINITTRFFIAYKENLPVFDGTPDLSYLRFYLKNILPRYKSNFAYISNFSFLNFLYHSSCGFFESLKQFKDAKKWVKSNEYKFVQDLQNFIESWKL